MAQIEITNTIREVKEDFNLMMFNSPKFTTEQMKIFNDIMEVLVNAKICINSN